MGLVMRLKSAEPSRMASEESLNILGLSRLEFVMATALFTFRTSP